MRIVYMGAGDIGLSSLTWMLEKSGHEIIGVYTQPDKRVGRKQVMTPPKIKVIAEAHGIPVFQPETFRKNEAALEELRSLEADLFVVMAYGQILPKAVIETPTIACVNLHASLLPRHRGASPIQAAIRDGDSETGITLMHIVAALDAGDMILKETLPILPSDTGGILHDKLADLGPKVLERGLPLLDSGEATRGPQDEDLVTYSPKLLRDDGEIDWTKSASTIERLIRAYDPWPGTYSWVDSEKGRLKLKLYPLCEVVEISGEPGSIIDTDGKKIVCCGEGGLILSGDLQLEGKKRLSSGDFFRGNTLTKLGAN